MDDVKEVVTPSEVIVPTEEVVEKPEVKAGDKTDPNLLLKSLQEERAKRKELEEKLAEADQHKEPWSDEGKLLQKNIDILKEELAVKDLTIANPALKDKQTEFNEFRSQYPGVGLDKIAKLFLAEHDLLEAPPKRIGLEKSSGGGRTVPDGKVTMKEFDELRTSNYRKYSQMLKSGQAPKE